MQLALGDIMIYLTDKGVSPEHVDRVRTTLPSLVETELHSDTMRELGIDIEDLTRSRTVEGPGPDDRHPNRDGITGPPNVPATGRA